MAYFDLPDVGEGLTEAEIVSWKVRPGDEVAVNDVLVEIETAKSLVELPSPFAGAVVELLVDEGETVAVGTRLIQVETRVAAAGEPADASDTSDDETREPVLVGYGPRPTRRRRRPVTSADEGLAALHGAFSTGHDVGLPVAPPPPPHPVSPVPAPHPAAGVPVGPFPDEDRDEASRRPLAKPPVRRLARDLGVELRQVAGTGIGGIVTRADVEEHARAHRVTAAADADHGAQQPATGWAGLPREERVAVRSVRRATARAVVASAFSVPHVTQFVTIDVSESMALLDRLRADPRRRDVRVSPLTLAARAMARAVHRTPEINALWDEAAGEIVLRRYVNLGVATATPRGLLVPVVRDADMLDLVELAAAISDLATRSREATTTPRDTSGGTISVTNIGVFGMDSGTPIIPPGQSAILALGAVARRPWVVEQAGEERLLPRWVTTLALSFDHRIVDGQQASAYLADVARSLRDPAMGWALD
jgi:pyruvate dehydrogenase E2 component (dihydrolipoamide acetyltransferase)